MNADESPSHLSSMEATRWSDVFAPNNPQLPAEVRRARLDRFFNRYSSAVRKYLRALLASHPQRDEQVEDCFQQFAVTFLEGSFGHCSPDGRFRHYLKAVLRNLVARRFRKPNLVPLDSQTNPVVNPSDAPDGMLEEILRERVVKQAMQRLAEVDARDGTHLHLVLSHRVRQPDLGYIELAVIISNELARQVDAGWVRKRVYYARDQMRQLIRNEVGDSLALPSPEAVDDELAALGLLEFIAK